MTEAKLIEHDDIVDGEYTWHESDESRAFEEFRAKFKDEEIGTLRVHRVPVTNRTTNAAAIRTVYLFSCPIDAFSFEDLLEHIRDNYGGGTFRIIGTRAGHRGHAFNRLIEIETPQKQFHIPGMEKTETEAGDNSALLVNNLGAVLLEHTSRIEALMRGSAAPMGDPMDQLTKMATAFGTIFGAMGIKPEKPKGLLDQLTEFAAVKELFDKGGGGAGEDNIYSLLTATIKNFGPIFGAAIAAQRQAGAIPATGAIPALPEPEPEPEETTMQSELEAMRPQIEFLLGQAKAGANADAVAAAVLPGIPAGSLESIEGFLQKPDCLDICAQVDAEVNEHRQWFTEWRDAMLDGLDKLLSEPEPEPGAGESPETDAGAAEFEDRETLTPADSEAQNRVAVAGHATDLPIRADASGTGDNGDANGDTVGDGGDAGDPGADAPASPAI